METVDLSILLIIVGVVLLLVFKALLGGRERYPYQKNESLLTEAERSFYLALNSAIGQRDLNILVKVRLADILSVKKGTREWQSHFNRISSKHIDFVLCDLSFKPILAIELDDSSHQRPERQKRDRFVDNAFKAAGLPILHVQVQRRYSSVELANQIKAALMVKS